MLVAIVFARTPHEHLSHNERPVHFTTLRVVNERRRTHASTSRPLRAIQARSERRRCLARPQSVSRKLLGDLFVRLPLGLWHARECEPAEESRECHEDEVGVAAERDEDEWECGRYLTRAKWAKCRTVGDVAPALERRRCPSSTSSGEGASLGPMG